MNYLVFRPRINKFFLGVIDLLTIVAVLTAVALILNVDIKGNGLFISGWCFIVILLQFMAGRYRQFQYQQAIRLASMTIAVMVIAGLITYPLMSGYDRQRISVLLLVMLFTGVGLFLTRRFVFDHVWSAYKPKMLFVHADGNDSSITLFNSIKHQLINNHATIDVISATDIKHDMSAATNYDQFASSGRFGAYDVIVYDPVLESDEALVQRFLVNRVVGRRVIDLIDFYSNITGRLPTDIVNDQWLLQNSEMRHGASLRVNIKRGIDVVVALLALVILALPLLLIALLIRLESPGGVIFRQERLGQHRKPFTIYKFRSMGLDAEKDGPKWATANDARVTRMGAFLRKSHLDELPQIFNLIRGDISLIGPRPIREHFADKLAAQFPYFDFRFLVKPGLTGWAQVLGPYGSNVAEQRVKLEMDLYYIHEGGFATDSIVVLKTGVKMLLGVLPQRLGLTESTVEQL